MAGCLDKRVLVVGGDRLERLCLARRAFSIYAQGCPSATCYRASASEEGGIGRDAWAVLSVGKLAYEVSLAEKLMSSREDILFALDWIGYGELSEEELGAGVYKACTEALAGSFADFSIIASCGRVEGAVDFGGRPELLADALWRL